MSFAEAKWTVAAGINIESSMLHDILYSLFMALLFSFVLHGKFLLVHTSFPYLAETLNIASMASSLRIVQPTAAKSFWQLHQPESSQTNLVGVRHW